MQEQKQQSHLNAFDKFNKQHFKVGATNRIFKFCKSKKRICININCHKNHPTIKGPVQLCSKKKRKTPNSQRGVSINRELSHIIFITHNVFVGKKHCFCPKCHEIAIKTPDKLEFDTESISYPSFDYFDEFMSTIIPPIRQRLINVNPDDINDDDINDPVDVSAITGKYRPRKTERPLDINKLSAPEIHICTGFDKSQLDKIIQVANENICSSYQLSLRNLFIVLTIWRHHLSYPFSAVIFGFWSIGTIARIVDDFIDNMFEYYVPEFIGYPAWTAEKIDQENNV